MNRRPSHEETLQYLEIAQRSAGMGYISLDPETMQLTFSSWVQELLGLYNPVMPVDTVASLVVPEERQNLMAKIAQIVEDREPFEFETVAIRHDGTPTRLRIAGNAVYTGATLTAFYAIAQDIEGFRKAEAEARASAAQAEAELAAGARVMATLSHEIRTPLTGIIGIIEQLRREPRAEERARGLALIEQSTEALLATLDGVLRGARARALGTSHERLDFAPIEVARRVADLFRPLARRKGLSLILKVPDIVPAMRCLGYPALLQQILSNLVSNAIKFTSGGYVHLTCAPPPDAAAPWRFVVRDTGIGIPPDRLRALFAAFGTSQPDSLGRDTGAGLGLSITKQLVDDMGGTLTIDSRPGAGTTIAVDVAMPPVIASLRGNRPGGDVRVLCASASRAIVVSAIAEDAGFAAAPLNGDDAAESPGGSILICDAALLGDLAAGIRDRFATVIAICEGDEATFEKALGGAAHASIAAARLPAELRQALADKVQA